MTCHRHPAPSTWLWVTVLVTLGGCVRAGFERDRSTIADRGPGLDRTLADHSAADASVERRRDASTDRGGPPDTRRNPDLPVDAKSRDAKLADAKRMEAAPPVGPCGTSAALAFTYSPTMVICTAATGSDQCQAPKRCGPVASAWHLCTATEFLARGGLTTAAPVPAWVAGCTVRVNDVMLAVSNAACGGCTSASGTKPAPVAWECGTGLWAGDTLALSLGAMTSPDCRRLGVNLAAAEGYWDAKSAGTSLSGSVCCK
jgi:hypothetical protein